MHSNGLIASKHTYGSRSLEKRSLEVHQGEQLILTQKKSLSQTEKPFSTSHFYFSSGAVMEFGTLDTYILYVYKVAIGKLKRNVKKGKQLTAY